MMTCETMQPLLDDYLDSSLWPDDMARVEAHLDTCAECRAEVEALRSIVADARALPRSVLPARELWSGVESRIGGPAVGSGAQQHSPFSPSRRAAEPPSRPTAQLPVRLPVSRLALQLAAAIALVLAGAALANLLRKDTPVSTAFVTQQQRYATETAELARQVTQHPDALPEATRAVVERNLAIVDAAIHDAEEALVTDPGNTALEQMVLARYEQRLALLKRANAAGRRDL